MKDILNDMEERIGKAIKATGQKKLYVLYSAYQSDENDEPIDNLDQIAVSGKVRLVNQLNGWGDKKSKEYRSEIMENPTWLQLSVCANSMIRCTRDYHHVFFEGLSKIGQEDDVAVYKLDMGS